MAASPELSAHFAGLGLADWRCRWLSIQPKVEALRMLLSKRLLCALQVLREGGERGVGCQRATLQRQGRQGRSSHRLLYLSQEAQAAWRPVGESPINDFRAKI